MIPKIIHYCWLSNDPIPEKYQRCRDTWDKMLTDYQFILWDTRRFDINSTDWTKSAFADKVYAAASDYIRLFAVYNYGGIYLDMDMEVLKPFDHFLDNNIMLAHENDYNKKPEAGCFGAEKNNPYIKACMDFYSSCKYVTGNWRTCPDMMEMVIDSSTEFKSIKLFTFDYFTAKNVLTGKIQATSNTCCIHHFASDYVATFDRYCREIMWNINSRFGINYFTRILFSFVKFFLRVKHYGLAYTLQYYYRKVKIMM